MPTLLMGHGQVLGDQKVIVPDGFTISFLIDAARVMPFSSGVGVVMNIESLQDEGFSLSSSHEGGEEISNHLLGVLTSNQRSWYAVVDPEDGSCKYAAEHFTDELRLCEDPGPTGQCAQNEGGAHTCGGLFMVADTESWDKDLVWVSCRQDPNPSSFAANKPQTTFGSEANDPQNVQKSEFADFAASVEKRLRTDPDGFADYFDSLSDEEVAQVLGKVPVRQWSFTRQARAWLQSGATDEQYYAFVQGQDEFDQGLYTKADDLSDAWERGQFVRHARDYLESHGPENFLLYVNGLDGASRTMLEAYPDLASMMSGTGDATSAEAQTARFGMTVDEIDWTMVQGISEKAIKDTPDDGDVEFWQLPTGQVLIGKNQQPETYRKLIELVRDGEANPTGNVPNGTITVTKGGITSSGKLDVTGATDEATMAAWIGEFSDKKVRFN